ncbi:hypothetical protein ABK040_011488 [Willaertia magna]
MKLSLNLGSLGNNSNGSKEEENNNSTNCNNNNNNNQEVNKSSIIPKMKLNMNAIQTASINNDNTETYSDRSQHSSDRLSDRNNRDNDLLGLSPNNSRATSPTPSCSTNNNNNNDPSILPKLSLKPLQINNINPSSSSSSLSVNSPVLSSTTTSSSCSSVTTPPPTTMLSMKPKMNLGLNLKKVREEDEEIGALNRKEDLKSVEHNERFVIDLVVPNLCTVRTTSTITPASSTSIEDDDSLSMLDIKDLVLKELNHSSSSSSSITRDDVEIYALTPIEKVFEVNQRMICCRMKQPILSVGSLSKITQNNKELKVKQDKTSEALLMMSRENEEMKQRIQELEKQKEETKKLVEQLEQQIAQFNKV